MLHCWPQVLVKFTFLRPFPKPSQMVEKTHGDALPPEHALCATVPGAAALWDDFVRECGTLQLEQVGMPALLPAYLAYYYINHRQ